MTYTVEWDESLKDYVRHHDYQISRFARWVRFYLVPAFVVEAVLLINKGSTWLGITSVFLAILTFTIYFTHIIRAAKMFKMLTSKKGMDKISYRAVIGEDKIVIDNLTENISTVRNYEHIWDIIEKKDEVLIEVDHEYICIDRRIYPEEFENELADFIYENEGGICA